MDKNTVALARFNLDRTTLRRAEFFLRQAEPKTRQGSGFAINGGLNALAAICAFLACEHTNSGQVTEKQAQSSACLAPRPFKQAVMTVRAALESALASTQSPRKHGLSSSPSKSVSPIKSASGQQGNASQPSTQLSFEHLCNWHRLPYHKIERPLNDIWEYLENRRWPEWDSTRNEARVAILWWISKNFEGLSELPPLRALAPSHKVNLKTIEKVVRILDSKHDRIRGMIEEHVERQSENVDIDEVEEEGDEEREAEALLSTQNASFEQDEASHGAESEDDGSPTKKRRKLDQGQRGHENEGTSSDDNAKMRPSHLSTEPADLASSNTHSQAQVQTPLKSALKHNMRDSPAIQSLAISPTKSVRISVSPSKRSRREKVSSIESRGDVQWSIHRAPKRYRPVFPDREFYQCLDD